MLRTPLYLYLDVLFFLQCTFSYSPSSRCHTNIGSEKYVITFAREKLFGLVGRDQKSMRGIQQQALSGRTREPHPYHPWDFFAVSVPSSLSTQKSRV
jgi:hypothetical protein